jgi:broad specificity phosphatase PhoE
MKNKYILLRHAETVKDPNIDSKNWVLTEDALEKIDKYISGGKFAGITRIISSTENKAVATGKPIAEFLNLPIEQMEEIVEVKREKKFLTDEEFLVQKQGELEQRDQKINGVESANEAIARFSRGIDKLEKEHTGEKILIITHGTIMTLYLAHVKNNFENIFEEWNNLEFCALVDL